MFALVVPDPGPGEIVSCTGYPYLDMQLETTAEWLVENQSIVTGEDFNITATYVPREEGTYYVCAYLVKPGQLPATVTTRWLFDAATPASTLSFDTSRYAVDDLAYSLRFTGYAGHSLELFVVAVPDPGPNDSYWCSGYPYVDARDTQSKWIVQGVPLEEQKPFSLSGSFVPDWRYGYHICAYLIEPDEVLQTLTETRFLNVRTPETDVDLYAQGAGRIGPSIKILVEGSFESTRILSVTRAAQGQGCDEGPLRASDQAATLLNRVEVLPGQRKWTFAFAPPTPGNYSLCARVDDLPSETYQSYPFPFEGSFEGSFRILRPESWVPRQESPAGGATRYERLGRLFWSAEDAGSDRLVITRIVDGEATRYRSMRVRQGRIGPGFTARRLESQGIWEVTSQDPAPYGRYSWEVVREDMEFDLPDESSAVLGFTVSPRPLEAIRIAKRLRKGRSIGTPGITRVGIRTAPTARVWYRLEANGRTFKRGYFREDRGSTSKLVFPWSCRRTGVQRLQIRANDRYGNERRRQVTWRVPGAHCAKLRLKAAQAPVSSGGGGSGGSIKDVDCADFSSQQDAQDWFDNNGGSSSNNVAGLDADGDGKVCE